MQSRKKYLLLQVLVTGFLKKMSVFVKYYGSMKNLDKKRQLIFGKNILRLRMEKGLSQDEVAARCRVTKGSLSVIENGGRNFSFTTLLALAKALEVNPRELLDVDFELEKD
ncbi:helix-turn-helix transcriptional regulator [Flavivirga aquimarina]|uniref:Helix-turn-helix transcriptional regulator n=1 Tax=Flavivirga aquimarina TaxID=2027862 RepID=A0ABT8W5T4_9FLAO|nr:helix-turn-helix transcriptional regulator [Flavivirga aquimarina]MDO5968473.1 helix-turn-helix transcriptional regulator [Flavivirga aquimarina]